VTEQLSCEALDADPPAVVAFENTERSAVEVTLVSARERREPSTELVSSGSNENFADPAKTIVEFSSLADCENFLFTFVSRGPGFSMFV
jgi:hypothetical protein